MADEGSCPLTAAKPHNPMVQKFHLVVANLRCFDVRKNCPDKKILFDFQDTEHVFLSKINKAPKFGPMYWPIFRVILKELNVLGKKVLGAKTEQDIDQLIREKITV